MLNHKYNRLSTTIHKGAGIYETYSKGYYRAV